MRLYRITAFLLFGLLMPSAAVQAKVTVESSRSEGGKEVTVDGSAEEWLTTMTYVDRAGLYIGVRNDDDFLYLCLQSSNREIGSRVLIQGLIVELGGKMSVQFPVESDADTLILTHSALPSPRTLSVHNDFGVEARLATEPDFVYELKVPLVETKAFPYAIEAAPRSKITVRVDVPEAARAETAGRPSGGMRDGFGGGLPGFGAPSGMSDDGRAVGTGDMSAMPEPIRFNVKVQLAPARPD